jgi:hypothetical protein
MPLNNALSGTFRQNLDKIQTKFRQMQKHFYLDNLDKIRTGWFTDVVEVQRAKVTAAAVVSTSGFGFRRTKPAGRIQSCKWARNQEQRDVRNGCKTSKPAVWTSTMIAGEERWTANLLKWGSTKTSSMPLCSKHKILTILEGIRTVNLEMDARRCLPCASDEHSEGACL